LQIFKITTVDFKTMKKVLVRKFEFRQHKFRVPWNTFWTVPV